MRMGNVEGENVENEKEQERETGCVISSFFLPSFFLYIHIYLLRQELVQGHPLFMRLLNREL